MATKTFKVSLSLDNPRIIQSGIKVRSFDKQSIKITIELTKNSQVYQIPTGAQIKISLLKLARQEQKIILDVPFTNADSIDWVVPDYLDGYQGEVRVGIYLIVGTENIDVGYFNITSSVSDIDSAAEEFTESVLQGWAIEDLTALLPKFQAVIDETTGKDVISAPEIILARNGEVDLKTRLDKEKQEVTAQLAQIVTNVKTLGAIGDGGSHPLSEVFSTLALAQMKYPHATSLTDEMDWCAIQLAINNHDNIFIPEGSYLINKTLDIPLPKKFIGANRYRTKIIQTTDNIKILSMSSINHEFKGLTLEYQKQQLRVQTNAIGLYIPNVSQSSITDISILKANTGLSSNNVKNWNNTLDNIFVENFSNIGIRLPGGSGQNIGGLFITTPYGNAKSGLEIEAYGSATIGQLNIEDGNYETPLLISGCTLTINALHFEAVTMTADEGYITTYNGVGKDNTQLVINSIYFYNNKLNSLSGITRGCILRTKQKTYATINGLLLNLFVSEYGVSSSSNPCDVPLVLLITDNNVSEVEFLNVYGGIIVGTNDYKGVYDPELTASVYCFVVNDEVQKGTTLRRVNTTVYSQRFNKDITAPTINLTNGGVVFPVTEVKSSNPNSLDDYREGTFTAGLLFGGSITGIAFSKNEGTYTKIGRVVYFTLTMTLASKGSSTGTAVVNGLPYDSNKKHSVNVTLRNVNNINGHIQATTKDTVSKSMDFEIATSTGVINLTDANFNNNTEIIVSGFYQI